MWHDRAVFHFLTAKEDREKYKQVLESSIKRGGCLIIAAFSIGGPKKCSGLDIVQYDAVKLKNELGNNFTFIEERHENHITPAGKEQKFGYYVFTKKCLTRKLSRSLCSLGRGKAAPLIYNVRQPLVMPLNHQNFWKKTYEEEPDYRRWHRAVGKYSRPCNRRKIPPEA